MSKRFSTLDTTRLLFEHPKILFRMIERMDRNEARYILESDLVAEVMDYTRTPVSYTHLTLPTICSV